MSVGGEVSPASTLLLVLISTSSRGEPSLRHGPGFRGSGDEPYLSVIPVTG
jgi:hypothetical protein